MVRFGANGINKRLYLTQEIGPSRYCRRYSNLEDTKIFSLSAPKKTRDYMYSQNRFVKCREQMLQYHRKTLISSFHLNGQGGAIKCPLL